MPPPSHLPPADAGPAAEPFPHLVALDGLRGVAVALVVGYHLFARQLPGGFLGVDIFFVLSGFLITSLLVDEVRGRGDVRLGRFYVRRARRLLPALFLVLLGLAAYSAIWGVPGELHRLREHSLWTLGYLANWRYIADGTTYTDLIAGQSPLRHTWSLAIEEQFYVLFPLMVIVIVKLVGGDPGRLRRALIGVGVVGAVLSAGWMAVVYDVRDPSRGYFGTDTRAHALLVGVALGALLVGRPPVTGRAAGLSRLAALIGIAVLAVAVALSHESSAGLQRGGFLVVALGTAGIIAGLQSLTPLRRALSVRPLVRLGIISYGVYLWHWPVIVLLNQDRTGIDGAALALLRLAVTLVVAVASFVLVERPIRQGSLGRAFGPVSVAFVPAAMVLLAGVVVSTTVVPRLSGGSDLGFLATSDGAGSSSTLVPLPRRVVIVGDSVAHTLAGATVGEYPDYQRWTPALTPFDPSLIELQSAATPACSFLPGDLHLRNGSRYRAPSDCAGWRDDIEAGLKGSEHPVVLIALANDTADRLVGDDRVDLGTPEHQALLTAWLDEVGEMAADHDGTLALLALPPKLGWVGREDDSSTRAPILRDELAAYAEAHDGVRFLDLLEQICPAGDCDHPVDGYDPAWRYDDVHFNRAGAAWVAAWVTPQLVYG